MKIWALAAGLAVLAGCAGAKKPIQTPPDFTGLDRADAQVLEGCYDCLLDARATYRRIAAGAGRPVVLTRLFETNLLIGLRHKELALDPSEPFAEARAVGAELPADVDAPRYLALADAVPGDDTGLPRRDVDEFRRVRTLMGFPPGIDAELDWLHQAGGVRPEVRDYLALAVDCAYPSRPHLTPRPAPARGPRQPAADAPPLIAYRTAICGLLNQPVLYRLRTDHQRWIEASIFLAQVDLALYDVLGPGRAAERLDEARARFPASPLAMYVSGGYYQTIGDCETALPFFTETVLLQPRHEIGLLGRTVCLTYTRQPDAAIATATDMITLNTYNAGQAYYWRAWNRHDQHALEQARADIEQAKRLWGTFQAYTLAGVIEYDQSDLDPAERDLTAARAMIEGDMNCTAIWYLAMVQTKRPNWPLAARRFEEAMPCYERQADLNTGKLRGIQHRDDLDERYKALQIAALEGVIKEATSQRYASALNAANYHAVAGNIASARRLLEIAAKDPALEEKVNTLRDWLKDKVLTE